MKESYWQSTSATRRFAKLDRNLTTDVVIVGGGITGISTAHLLKRAGLRVILLERDRVLGGDTAHTTAHLTCVTDTRLHKLVKQFGAPHAKAVWEAGMAALHTIEENVTRAAIDCDFRRVPGYLHAPLNATHDEIPGLTEDARLAADFGFDAEFVEDVPLFNVPGVRIANQAKFHPLKYLSRLLASIDGGGSHVFEESEAVEFSENPLTVSANGHTIECSYIVIATHVPLTANNNLLSATLFQTKIAPYSSYVIGAVLPRFTIPEACFWDTADPYHYLRVDSHAGGDYVIFGGEDRKTGQTTDTVSLYARLESALHAALPHAVVERRWSGQVIETADGLPYIGEIRDQQFLATGFGGNGMTFGTLAAMLATDAVLHRPNPWKELFDPHRKKLRAVWDYLKENADYPFYLLKDRLARAQAQGADSVAPNEGKILRLDGKRVAAYRDPAGHLTLLSATCTHMGCVVHWNNAEKTWDCPCHGSRFHCTGELLAGPAETPLTPLTTGATEIHV